MQDKENFTDIELYTSDIEELHGCCLIVVMCILLIGAVILMTFWR